MFFLKKFISGFLMPVPLVLEFLITGWLLSRYSRFKRTGTALKVLALLLFLAFGYGIGDGYLYSLERRYPPFERTPEQCEQLRGAMVVVLGQGLPTQSDLLLRHRENRAFMLRLLEGMQIAKRIPDSHLIVSMAGAASEQDKRMFLDDFAGALSFPTNRVSMVTTARDTKEEVAFSCAVISNRISKAGQAWPATVVATSASHIPRSVLLFERMGVTPVTAPCDYLICEQREWLDLSRIRGGLSGGQLLNAEVTFHEGIGLIYETILGTGHRGRVNRGSASKPAQSEKK